MIKTLKQQVEFILQTKPYTRNSDIDLWVELVSEFHWTTFLTFVNSHVTKQSMRDLMMELPNQDNIKRFRAMLNQVGKYLPTDWKIAKARRMKEDEWKLALGYSTATPGDHEEARQQQQHLASI